MSTERASQHVFAGVMALLFAASTAATIAWCTSMSAMCAMPMPGGWTMSMTWLRMPGQSWPGAAASFLCMWFVMMLTMMLPSVAPALFRYRRAVGVSGTARLGALTALVAGGYFAVWTAIGLAIYLPGAMLAAAVTAHPEVARAVPVTAGAVLVAAGIVQRSTWKARQLASCRAPHWECARRPVEVGAAWRHGLRLGWHCSRCSLALKAALLAVGMMDLRAVAAVATAITAERLLPRGERVARAIGGLLVAAGLLWPMDLPESLVHTGAMELLFGCSVWVFIAFVVLWILGRNRGPKPVKFRDPDWEWTDFDPPMKPAHDRAPDSVKHSLDLEASTYRVLWTWYNDDIAAESDIGIVTEEFAAAPAAGDRGARRAAACRPIPRAADECHACEEERT